MADLVFVLVAVLGASFVAWKVMRPDVSDHHTEDDLKAFSQGSRLPPRNPDRVLWP
jgi:hypothetical protein